MAEIDIKNKLFDLVLKRLVNRKESLELFCKHWEGSAAGIEGWFKVEFVAAIEPAVAKISTGGGGGKGREGHRYCDLIVETEGVRADIELKAGISEWFVCDKAGYVKYSEHLLAFITRSSKSMLLEHRQELEEIDRAAQLGCICDLPGDCGLYFGMLDLRTKH